MNTVVKVLIKSVFNALVLSKFMLVTPFFCLISILSLFI